MSAADAMHEIEALVLELDADGRIADIGAAGARRLGYTREELLGEDAFERLVPRSARADMRRGHAAVFRGEPEAPGVHERLVVDREGHERRVAWRTTVAADREPKRAYAVALELDARFNTDAEFERTFKALGDIRRALDVSAIVAITDRAGVITFVNDHFCKVSQYSREELLGKTHRVVKSDVHPPEFFEGLWSTIAGGKVWRGDLANRAKDGSIYWVDTTIVPFLDATGRPYQYCAIRHEITQRKQLERELLEANHRIREEQLHVLQVEKLSSIGVLAAGVAHEINNPLAGVLSCVKALRDQEMAPARRREYFATVLDGLERIQATVRSLLDYSGHRNPKPSAVPLDELLRSVLLLVSPAVRKKDVHVEHKVAPDATAFADRAQLMQALVNVVLNAIYACPDHGRLRLEAHAEGDRTRLTIVDSGPGFDPDTINRVCDPFFTTKPEGEGTGLGLAVTLSVIEANGGTLHLANEPSGGARVEMLLPRERV